MSAKEQDRQDACGTDNNEDSDASSRPSPLATRPDIPISSTGGGGWSARRWSILLTIAGLAALLGVAIWLRWQVVQQSNLYIDEFTTLWAARRVQAVGAPITPSDVLYTRGLLATYAAAAFTAFGGPLHVMGRLPSVLFGLLSIVAVFFVGQARVERQGRLAGSPWARAALRLDCLGKPGAFLRSADVLCPAGGLVRLCYRPIGRRRTDLAQVL